MYIVDSEQVKNIYDSIKDFEIYSFEGETIIDPSYDIGDILIVEGKTILYQGELEYSGKFMANIKSKIQAKSEQESMQTKENLKTKVRRVQSQIDQVEGTITQLVQETGEYGEKLTQVQQTVDNIKQNVGAIADYKRKVEGVTEIHLTDSGKADVLKFEIRGNKTYASKLYPSENLYPNSALQPNMEGSELL